MQAKQETSTLESIEEMGKPPTTTSPLEHAETKVETTAQNYAATGTWAQKEAAVGKAGWGTCHKDGSRSLFQV